jgi:hypothetical protein
MRSDDRLDIAVHISLDEGQNRSRDGAREMRSDIWSHKQLFKFSR